MLINVSIVVPAYQHVHKKLSGIVLIALLQTYLVDKSKCTCCEGHPCVDICPLGDEAINCEKCNN